MNCFRVVFGTKSVPGKPSKLGSMGSGALWSRAAIVWAMTTARRKTRPEEIRGLKYFKVLQGLIERLRLVGT